MPDVRHKVTIDVGLNDAQAQAATRRLNEAFDKMQQAAAGVGQALTGGIGPGGGGGGGAPGAPAQPGSTDSPAARRERGRPRRGALGMGLAAGAGAAMGAMAGANPAMPLLALGTAGAAAMGSIEGKSRAAQIARGAAPFLGAGAGALAAGVAQRAQRATALGQIQRQLGVAGLSGVGGGFGAGAEFGMAPQETAALMRQFGQGVGFRGPQPGFLRQAALGVGVGAMAQFRGMGAPGAGGIQTPQTMGLMIRRAFQEGLRGARIDQWLQTISQNTQQMAEQGLDVSMTGMEQFIGRMQATEGLRGAGVRLPRIAARLGQPVMGARQQLLQPFQQLGEAAVMAQAMGAGGGMMGALGALEAGAAGPGGPAGFTREAVLRAFGGGDVSQLFFAAQAGVPTGMARALAGPLGEAQMPRGLPGVPGVGIAAQVAQMEAGLLRGITQEDAKSLISSIEALKSAMDTLGEAGQAVVRVINDPGDVLMGGISSQLQSMEGELKQINANLAQ